MDFHAVVNILKPGAKKWITSLSTYQLAGLIDAFYELETHKVAELESNITGVNNVDKVNQRVITSTVSISTPVLEQYAANIGKYGEQSFADVTKTLPCNYRVCNTAKDGHAGDFIIEYSMHGRVYKCLVDIKTYKSTIPKKEIDKFISDLMYGNYDGGLLVSQKSHFVGRPESIYIEDVTVPYATVPVMYLAKIDNDLINSCIEVICAKMSTLVAVQMDQSTIMNSVNFINNSLQQLGVTRRILSEMQLTTTSQIQRCQETLISSEIQIKMCLKQMRNEITHPKIITSPTPKFILRDDHPIDNISIISADPLPLVDNLKFDKIERVNDLPDDIIFIYKKFCVNDTTLIHQMTEFGWSKISQDDNGTNARFESPFVNIDVKPLKTKTRVEIFDVDNVGMSVPNDITTLLTRHSKKYIGTLTQVLIEAMQKYF
jgi:hypothetical protein